MHFYFIVNDDVNDVGRHTIPLPLVVSVSVAAAAAEAVVVVGVVRIAQK